MKNTHTKKQHIPEIVQMGHPALHTPALPVAISDIKSNHIQTLIKDMIRALESQKDGVGIAAPQIGVSLQVFIVAGHIYDRMRHMQIKRKLGNTDEAQQEIRSLKKTPHQIFINPEIVKESKEKKWFEGEGCLSVRWLYGKVYRSTRVTLRWHDEHGEIHEQGASGFLAHIFQHEIDHLNGILFIDKARDIQEFDPHEATEDEATGDSPDTDEE